MMEIIESEYGLLLKPNPPIKEVGGCEGTFNLKRETVEQIVEGYPAYLTKSTRERLAAIAKDVDLANGVASTAQRVTDDLSRRFESLLPLFNENTNAIGKIQDDLRDMPGGYRNSQDIKKLQKRIEEINELLRPGSEVTVHSRLGDLEEMCKRLEACGNVQWMQGIDQKLKALDTVARTMAMPKKASQSEDYHMHIKELRKEVEELNHLRTKEAAETKQRITALEGACRGTNLECNKLFGDYGDRVRNSEKRLSKLEQSNEQRKKDIKHAWNLCEETQKEMAIHRSNFNSINGALTAHMVKCAQYNKCGDPTKKIEQMEECCKNTVAAGKEVEKRMDFVEASLKNHSSRLDQHKMNLDGLTKQAVRLQKFMDKLHEL